MIVKHCYILSGGLYIKGGGQTINNKKRIYSELKALLHLIWWPAVLTTQIERRRAKRSAVLNNGKKKSDVCSPVYNYSTMNVYMCVVDDASQCVRVPPHWLLRKHLKPRTAPPYCAPSQLHPPPSRILFRNKHEPTTTCLWPPFLPYRLFIICFFWNIQYTPRPSLPHH